jgi:hypothetical protein
MSLLHRTRQLSLVLPALLAASVGPLIFPAAQAGYGSMAEFATRLLLPAIGVLGLVAAASRKWNPALSRSILLGAAAGALATIALEAIRIPGYLWGYMPGNLPRLMGVLLLDRFALGPSAASDVAGWAYHFWNGASFGILYVLVFGVTRRWLGALYGIAVGIGFMLSPVVVSLGVGYFGLQYSLGFPVVVLTAHVGFGLALGFLAGRFLWPQRSVLLAALRPGQTVGERAAASARN